MHYTVGNIELDAHISLSLKKMNEESYPEYKGTGKVYLEPCPARTKFLFVPLHEEVVHIDKEVFYACGGNNLKFDTVWIKGFKAKLLGGEGLTEHKFEGTGWVLLRIPVPSSEIHKIKMSGTNSVVKIDGDFALLRKGNIKKTVQSAGKGLGNIFFFFSGIIV